MITGGIEVIIGVVQEPVFGPLVVFGLGGVATEVLGDHAARLTPLTADDADELIHAIRAAPLLLGHRGSRPPTSRRCGTRCSGYPGSPMTCRRSAELDLNPVIARADGIPGGRPDPGDRPRRRRRSCASCPRPDRPLPDPSQANPAPTGIPAKELIPT